MVQVWKIAPGERAEDWGVSHDRGCICLGWMKIRDFGRFQSEEDVLQALKRAYPDKKEGNREVAARSIYRFGRVIRPSHVVIASNGLSGVVGIGVVTSPYLPPNSPKNPIRDDKRIRRRHARLVDWRISQPVDLQGRVFTPACVHRLKPERCEQIKRAYLKKYPRLKAILFELLDGVAAEDDGDGPVTDRLLKAAEEQLTKHEAFDPTGIEDARQRIASSIVRRGGRPAFRKHLLAAYKGRCAITGCEVEAILEAARIVPYMGSKTNHPGNGLLLRADVHTLFDLGLVAVDEATMRVLISPGLQRTEYKKYDGQRIRVPDAPANQPSAEALKRHRLDSGLGC